MTYRGYSTRCYKVQGLGIQSLRRLWGSVQLVLGFTVFGFNLSCRSKDTICCAMDPHYGNLN